MINYTVDKHTVMEVGAMTAQHYGKHIAQCKYY